jgi:hypothetical protein
MDLICASHLPRDRQNDPSLVNCRVCTMPAQVGRCFRVRANSPASRIQRASYKTCGCASKHDRQPDVERNSPAGGQGNAAHFDVRNKKRTRLARAVGPSSASAGCPVRSWRSLFLRAARSAIGLNPHLAGPIPSTFFLALSYHPCSRRGPADVGANPPGPRMLPPNRRSDGNSL